MLSYHYFVSQSSEFCRHNPLCCFWTSNTKCKSIFLYVSVRKLLDTPSYVNFVVHMSRLNVTTSWQNIQCSKKDTWVHQV